MQITDVRVRKVTREGKMRAVVSVTFDNEFVVHDIKVIDGDSGLFIAMPSKKSADGTYRDVAHPINKEMRAVIQEQILAGYREALASMDEYSDSPEDTIG
ncbi:MAG: septation regulator SpoVG [Lachnospiraceae bacterium]|nr:septation regulator SpoVG [Lachnospiraceae bacterium]